MGNTSRKALKRSRPASRSSSRLLVLLAFFLLATLFVVREQGRCRQEQEGRIGIARSVVASLGLSDLALASEARYTRHPLASDPLVVGMDHPGAVDRFPSTLFWAPPR